MSAADKRNDKKIIYAQAFLQEFYPQSIIGRFYDACVAFECDIAAAMTMLKYIVMQNLAFDQSYPEFTDLAEMYAEKMDLDAELFTQRFYLPRRDQN